jgi:hypothetical protein
VSSQLNNFGFSCYSTPNLQLDDGDGTYAFAVSNAVQKHGSRTREQWKKELYQDKPQDQITSNYSEFAKLAEFDDDDLYS